jgi:hypothetical protein
MILHPLKLPVLVVTGLMVRSFDADSPTILLGDNTTVVMVCRNREAVMALSELTFLI